MASSLIGVLLVKTISAPAARSTTLSAGVLSCIVTSPNVFNPSQLISPGLRVYPSSTTIFILDFNFLQSYEDNYEIRNHNNYFNAVIFIDFRLLVPRFEDFKTRIAIAIKIATRMAR